MTRTLLALMCAVVASGCAAARVKSAVRTDVQVRAVESVDLPRYLGAWFELASIPKPFELRCNDTIFEYEKRDDGQLTVVRRCEEQRAGKTGRTEGVARIVDRNTNSRFEVSLGGPFWDDHWVIDLDAEYNFAVIGDRNHRTLTILSRSQVMPSGTFTAILARARAQGYDTTQLHFAQHSASMLSPIAAR
jgi:apolipoprotein D and lipocalin family protein